MNTFLFVLFPFVLSSGNTWRTLSTSAALPPLHSSSSVVVRDASPSTAQLVLVYGGRDEVFNLRQVRARPLANATAAWSVVSNTGQFRREHCAVGINDGAQMLAFGGYGGSSDATSMALLSSLDAFTPSNNYAWSTLAPSASPAPSGRAKMACAVHRGAFLYVFGGITAAGRVAELWRFDLGAQKWADLTASMTGDVPPPLSGHTATILNNDTLVVFGGYRDAQFELREVRLLDLTTLEWRLRSSPSIAQPLPREGHVAFPIAGATQLVVVGGLYNGAFLDDVWALEPLSAAWVQLAKTGAPSKRAGASAAVSLDGKLVPLIAGTDGLPRSDAFEYTPPTCTPGCLNFGICDGTRCVCDSTGYNGTQCQTPICSPPCQNGGACVAPNTCKCDSATRGGKPAYGRFCEGYCGDSILQTPQETCDDGNAVAGDCCANCQPEKFDTVCRPVAGVCDVAEQCEGKTKCPTDTFVNGTVCRATAGPCDVAEKCDGSGAACPIDRFVASGVVCRARDGNNTCDVADTCNGAAAACPPDRFAPEGTLCDDGDMCSTTDTCSATGVCQAGVSTCNCNVPGDCDDKNPCTVDTCVNKKCVHNAGNMGTVCRPKAGSCDVEEQCDGALPYCPRDRVEMFGVVCRASGGDCDLPELCDGRSALCAPDAKLFGDLCRRALGVCDTPEYCDGTNNSCPADQFRSNTTVCRASKGTCDPAEYCDGKMAVCGGLDFLSPIGSSCEDGDLCTTNDKCVAGGNCVGEPVSPCARFDVPTPSPAPGSTAAPPANEAQACYTLRDNCELCLQLDACGYCATHGGMTGACNPNSVRQQCLDIGGSWSLPCDTLALPPPTPPFTPVPTRPRPSPTPPTPAPTFVRTTTVETTREPSRVVVTVRDPFGGVSLPDIFMAGNGSDSGPLGLGWGSVGSLSLEWIFIIGLIVFCLICCCGFGLFAFRVKRARDIGRGRRSR